MPTQLLERVFHGWRRGHASFIAFKLEFFCIRRSLGLNRWACGRMQLLHYLRSHPIRLAFVFIVRCADSQLCLHDWHWLP